jgi:hypothetical protein
MTEILSITLMYGKRIFHIYPLWSRVVEASWNVMAHAQKPDFVFRQNRRVHLNRRWRQFSRLLSAELCASAVVMLDTQCSKVVWKVLATQSIRQFPVHFHTRASPCAITFQLTSTAMLNATKSILFLLFPYHISYAVSTAKPAVLTM